MSDQTSYPRWAPWVAALAISAAVGWAAYSAGLQQGGGLAATGRPLHVHPFFPFGWLFGFFVILFIVRAFAWGCGGPWRRRYYDRGSGAWYDDPARWDEWHRRAHEHMKDGPNTGR
jgi:hypothetical protein